MQAPRFRPHARVALAVGLLAGGCAVFAPNSAQAACFSTADAGANGCFEFSPDTTSAAVQTFATANLDTNQYVQFGFQSSGPSVTLTGVEYSFNGGTSWITYGAGTFNVTSTASYGSVITDPLIKPGLKFRYTIPTGLALGDLIQAQMLTNNTGTPNPLASAVGNNFVLVDRASTAAAQPATATPGPLPLLGAAAAFSASRRLRRRIQRAA